MSWSVSNLVRLALQHTWPSPTHKVVTFTALANGKKPLARLFLSTRQWADGEHIPALNTLRDHIKAWAKERGVKLKVSER